jgi:hypothetical protein
MLPEAEPLDESQSASAGIADGVSALVGAALGVGAAIAKVVAEATAGSKPLPPPKGNGTPIDIIVHYGIATVGNVVGAGASAAGTAAGPIISSIGAGIVSGIGSKIGAQVNTDSPGNLHNEHEPVATSQPGNSAKTQEASGQVLPRVHQGATLRMPLSIENPGPEPMTDMVIKCLSLIALSSEAGELLKGSAVRLQPESLSIEPRDFEKLVVYIDTTTQTATGLYELVLGTESFQTRLQFQVIPATEAS